ncbi:hypothetical protein HOF78_01115 [Candidatus Woesearchaeota archaeon]|jgi:farnesyl diphosphate synthase|nr:hypothetical protein [Candidatus Woesearchaeota archaeon]MBT6045014.1 hypothetical protein [Candidatus Woesearchaeota archaeon]
MNDVDLVTELYNDLKRDLSKVEGEMGEMVRYAVLRKGGLLRPQLAIRSGEVYGVPMGHMKGSALPLENVHAATLILDDSSAMDDSDTRNGEVAFHKVYSLDKTILTAQHLTSSIAPELNSNNLYLSPEIRIKIQAEYAKAAEGLCIGQLDDLHHKPESLEDVVELHRKKTGVLFAAATVIGGLAGSAPKEEIEILRALGHNLGIAYQMGDDIYDVLGNPKLGGKPIGQDGNKITVLGFMEVHKAVELWKGFYDRAGNDIDNLSSRLLAREEQGLFTGIASAEPLRHMLEVIRNKQEGIMAL